MTAAAGDGGEAAEQGLSRCSISHGGGGCGGSRVGRVSPRARPFLPALWRPSLPSRPGPTRQRALAGICHGAEGLTPRGREVRAREPRRHLLRGFGRRAAVRVPCLPLQLATVFFCGTG